MPQIVIESIQQLGNLVGREVVVSDWLTITQQHINLFAEATGDRQWIHVDLERAANESPYKTTVAHGFLTLSLLAQLLGDSLKLTRARIGVNYGFNRVRFPDIVSSGSRVRARFVLQAIEPTKDHGVQLTWNATVEREGSDKPCLVAEWLTRHYE